MATKAAQSERKVGGIGDAAVGAIEARLEEKVK